MYLKVDVLQRSLIYFLSSLMKRLKHAFFLDIVWLARATKSNKFTLVPSLFHRMLYFEKRILFTTFIFHSTPYLMLSSTPTLAFITSTDYFYLLLPPCRQFQLLEPLCHCFHPWQWHPFPLYRPLICLLILLHNQCLLVFLL